MSADLNPLASTVLVTSPELFTFGGSVIELAQVSSAPELHLSDFASASQLSDAVQANSINFSGETRAFPGSFVSRWQVFGSAANGGSPDVVDIDISNGGPVTLSVSTDAGTVGSARLIDGEGTVLLESTRREARHLGCP